MQETPANIGFATVRQSHFDCRTKKACDSHAKTYVMLISTVAPKILKNKSLRQCDSLKMTVANQLSQAACDSATVPYYIGTACTDRRSVAAAREEVTHPRSIAHVRFATDRLRIGFG